MPAPHFSIGEIEPIRVKKLNELEGRVEDVETNAGGGSTLLLDGGDSTSTSSSIVVDGGGA